MSEIQIASYSWTIILFIAFSLLLASCNHELPNSKLPNSKATEINEPQKEKLVTDTSILGIEKTDSLNKTAPKEVSRVPLNRDPQIRLGEGVSDAKLNGEQILLQEELSEKILLKNPDTIKYYLKQIYLGQEQNFPRSIADDFEHGISKEYVLP